MDRRNPICRPLMTLEEVLSWKPPAINLNVSTIPKRPREGKGDTPRLLVCHDMKGGYLEDRLVQGCGKMDGYRFYHWQYVDIFVYFTHYFVTIPPLGWTNAGHRHGVEVLGTVITEWDDGKARCEGFLKSTEAYQQFADQLVSICKTHGFDGWLVNIENVIETEESVENLRGFVEYLTKKQHDLVPGSKVIWYDSVVTTGKLDWQNALNDNNRMFFDACDGIFLNYCWKDSHLEESKSNAVEAKRPFDVYVGIDVFGRGCLGDGGYNTREALQAVTAHNLSTALFAQGWVYETQEISNFTENENKFWRLIHDLLHVRKYTTLPLSTTFCQGFGERFFDYGVPVGNPWYNLNIQQLQPNYTDSQFDDDQSTEDTSNDSIVIGSPGMDWSMTKPDVQPKPKMGVYTQNAFIGGACLKMEGEVCFNKFPDFRLFSLDVDLKQYTAVYVSVTYKILQDPDCDIFLELHLQHDDQSIVLVLVPFPDGDKPLPTYGRDTATMFVRPLSLADLPKILSQSSSPSQTSNRWKTRWFPVYNLYLKFCKLTLVKACLTTTDPQPKTCIALLGEIKIIPSDGLPDTFPSAEFVSAEADTSTSYPLMDVSKNNFNQDSPEDPEQNTSLVDWGVDNSGQPIKVSYETLDKMRVTSHTLKEIRPVHRGRLCEILYRLITSLDCFLLHWKISCPEIIDHYRVYQIKIDSGVAKLLGHVTESFFKVTWFEIPDYERDEQTHHFKFVIRPVLRNGLAVPLDYNFCKLFHMASTKESVKLLKDSCSTTDNDIIDMAEAESAPSNQAITEEDIPSNQPTNQNTSSSQSTNQNALSSQPTNQADSNKETNQDTPSVQLTNQNSSSSQEGANEEESNEELINTSNYSTQVKDNNKQCDKDKEADQTSAGKAKGKKKDGKALDIEQLTKKLNLSDE